MKVLFLNQGRARSGSAMGLIRAQQAIELGFPKDANGHVEAAFETVPPFTNVQRAATRRVPGVGWNDLLALRWHLVRGWAARRLILRRVRRDPPDVIHVATVQVAFLLGRIARRRPCVLSVDVPMIEWTKRQQGLAFDDPTPANLRPLAALERRALERAPLCIAWTESIAANVRRAAPRARVRVLHPGIDLEQFRPRSSPAPGGPVRVLFVGGRWRDKGGPELLEALGDDLGSSVALDVVSPDPEVPQRPGVTVHDTSRPGSSDTATLFRQADVFCLPTHSDGAPLVIVEALASGLPIVSTPVGSIRELAGDAGVIVPTGDVTELRTAVRTLIEDPALRARMGAAGRARAEERYDARRNTPELLRILEDVAARHDGGVPA